MRPMDDMNCEQCGYNLAGLPRIGNCPECGLMYNKSTGEGIHAQGMIARRQAKFDAMLARVRTLVLAGVAALFLGGGVLGYAWKQNATVLSLGLVFGLFFALAAVTSFLYEKPE